MLVTYVLGDCPGCGGKQQFGNISVQGDRVLRGCKNCKYSITIPLPKIRKKILYLDQFFFSNAFKAKDPLFISAVDRIRKISSLQLLAVPFSSIHEDETHQWTGFDGKNKEELMEFIKATSRGHKFQPSWQIEKSQNIKAFQAFLADQPQALNLEECAAITGDIHEWDNYYRIDAGRYFGDIELIRDLKNKSVENLVDLFSNWRSSTTTFDQYITFEIQAAARNYFETYVKFVFRIASGDSAAFLDSPSSSEIVQSFLFLLSNNISEEMKMKKIIEFFNSPHFAEMPYNWISARIFATLKDMVKQQGAYKNRDRALKSLRGFFKDTDHIATYAPYCDAFIMDKPMASLVTKPCIGLKERYGVEIFSLNNWDQFLMWLDELEASMSSEHRSSLAVAYP